ncbi:hypothetical protein PLICRDRAFT_173554 [Plicaturopsis crispa FD-325 SS-3]|nr:hypothetical protein PLICRDRAFT_173554 [Plicaturopsis crispa FD-325 SS-3]
MSGKSPTRRLRSKTSDISEFLRHGSSRASSSRDTDPAAMSDPPPPLPPMPELSDAPKRSRIPAFLGRSKTKKSPGPSRKSARLSRDSTISAVPKPSITAEPEEPSSPPVLPTAPSTTSLSSTLPPVNVSPQSLGSKFAAHFTPSKLRMPSSPKKTAKSPLSPESTPPIEESTSLSPSSASNLRGPSHETTRSSVDGSRAQTPRGNASHPAITVSVSPPAEDTMRYGDLYFSPRDIPDSTMSPAQSAAIPGHIQDESSPGSLMQSPSPPTTPHMEFPNPPSEGTAEWSLYRHKTISASSRRSSSQDPSSTPSTTPSRQSVDSRRTSRYSQRSMSGASTKELNIPGPSLDPDSAHDLDSNRATRHESPSLSRRPSQASEVSQRGSIRARKIPRPLNTLPSKPPDSRYASPKGSPKGGRSPTLLRSPSSIPKMPTTAPPAMPLPSPPMRSSNSNLPPLSGLPSIPSMSSLPSLSSRKSVGSPSRPSSMIYRPRAQTMANDQYPPDSVPPPMPSSPQSTSPREAAYPPNVQALPPTDPLDKENSASTTPEQLREALAGERARYSVLASHLTHIREKNDAEKMVLEKRIETLEREAKRREQEIAGLRWLVMNGTAPNGARTGNRLRAADSQSTINSESLAPSTSAGANGSRTSLTDVEDHDHQSKLRSASSMPNAHNAFSASGTATTRSPPNAGLGIDLPELSSLQSAEKIIPGASLPSSAASSTSSLPLAGDRSSAVLSAIPESPPPSEEGVSEATLAVQRQQEKEERRASRALRRMSVGSTASVSSIAAAPPSTTAAYAANLDVGRSPSIAQLLEQSPDMEGVLEMLRPFAGLSSDN